MARAKEHKEILAQRQRATSVLKDLGVQTKDGEDENFSLGLPDEDFHTVQISAEDIAKAARTAKRSTSGGLQQITPWFLRIAVFNSPGNRCARVMAKLGNRWARGDFDSSIGALWAMGRLIPLYKSNTDNIRPVCVSSSLRRLLTRAFNNHLKARLEYITEKHQLGTKRGGY